MRYVINESSHKPLYLQIYEQVREDIVKEYYPYGTKLPSKRTVADDLSVSTITVEHAYGLLLEEGYIESRERSGFFVIFKKVDGFASSKRKSEIPIAYHEREKSVQFPFSVLTKTMRRVMSDYGEAILTKSPNIGCAILREAISDYLARNRGIHTDPEQIVVGSGAEYLYGLIVELLGENLVYGIESPSYEKIEKVYEASRVKIELLPLGSDGIDSSALTQTKAQVLHITPYRSFPTGITASASKRHEYIRWAQKGRRFIVEDDFESEFSVSSKPEETLYALSESENVIYMNTFTRTVSPSLRVGYMVLPKALASEFQERLGIYSCTVPTFEQYVLTELIVSGDFERHINRVRRNKRREIKSN